MTRTHRVAVLVVLAMVLAVSACGDDGDDSAGSGDDAATTTEAAAEGSTGNGSTDVSSMEEMSADDQAAVDDAIESGVSRVTDVAGDLEPVGLWVGVWDPDTGSYLVAQGDAADGQEATVEDHFRIGSITKTFTATVILQLIDEGELSLDDTVADVLPDLAEEYPDIADLTVESLLNMTSGLEDYLNVPDGIVSGVIDDPARVWEAEELIASGVGEGVVPDLPGYSTTNYIILQLMAESIEGKPLAESIEARLTGPLGMDGSALPAADDASLPEPSTAGHFNSFCVNEFEGDGAEDVDTTTDPTDWNLSYARGGGAMYSTLADMGAWAASNSGTSTLSDELASARLETDTELTEGITYGLGIYQTPGGWLGHEGEAFGWEAQVFHDPDTGRSVVMASNSCAGNTILFASILNELYPDDDLDAFVESALES